MNRAMRRNPTPAVSAKLYRHFAVTTVALTALVALFANGDTHDAAAAETSPRVEVPKKADDRPQATSDASQGDTGTWGADVAFGQPSATVASDGGSFAPDIGPWQPDLTAPAHGQDGQPGLTTSDRDELARAVAKTAIAQAPQG